MAVIAVPPFWQFYAEDGITPLAGGKIYTYAAGTTTPKATYTDATSGIQATNPVILDSLGRATLWLQGSYKFVVTDSNGIPISDGTVDNVTSFTAATSNVSAYFQSFSGNGAQTSYTLSQDLGTDSKAVQIFVNNSSSVSNTPLYEALNNTSGQTVFNTVNAYGTDPAAIMVVQASAAGVFSKVLRPTTDYTVTTSGSTSTITLTTGIATAYNPGLLVFKNPNLGNTATGVGFQVQNPAAYSLNGTSLSFSTPPGTGVNNILVFAPSTLIGLASTYASAADSSSTAAGNSAVSAASSASSASADRMAADNDVVLTHADVLTTHADVVSANNAASTATTQAGIATTQAGISTTQAGTATTQAGIASNAAIQAGSTFTSTSTTSNSIATGSKTFTTQINKNYVAGQFIEASSGVNYMAGMVVSYNNSNGTLVINSTNTSGSGTFNSWNIGVIGAPGLNGGGAGTVTSVSVIPANGVSGSVATATSTPAITLTLGDVTPSSVASTGSVTGSNLSGTNTGDQTTITGNAGSATKLQNARTINGVSFDGTSNITIPTGTAATQSDQEAASSNTVYASPATQQYHPSAAKAWIRFAAGGTPIISASYNVTSITRLGTGNYQINFTIPFSSNAYTAHANAMNGSGGAIGLAAAYDFQAGYCTIRTQDITNSSVDYSRTTFTAFGDQ